MTPAKRVARKKPAPKVEEPELLPDQVLLDAIDEWKAASQAYTDAYNAKTEAQVKLVAALRELGVVGLNL